LNDSSSECAKRTGATHPDSSGDWRLALPAKADVAPPRKWSSKRGSLLESKGLEVVSLPIGGGTTISFDLHAFLTY
jgi:hypothetical protein